jgi:hypothetical protein
VVTINFQQQVTAGTVLVIERIESQNYEAGVSGWMIAADGSAEFFNVIARGEIVTGPDGTLHVAVRDNGLFLYSGQADELQPGQVTIFNVGDTTFMTIATPSRSGAGDVSIQFTQPDNAADTDMTLTADTITLNGELTSTLWPAVRSPATALNAWTASGGLWYYRSVDGMVHIGGRVTGGALNTACINLPADYRPVEQMQFARNANGAYGSIRVDTNGNVVPTSGSTTQVSLSGINFPSFA